VSELPNLLCWLQCSTLYCDTNTSGRPTGIVNICLFEKISEFICSQSILQSWSQYTAL